MYAKLRSVVWAGRRIHTVYRVHGVRFYIERPLRVYSSLLLNSDEQETYTSSRLY